MSRWTLHPKAVLRLRVTLLVVLLSTRSRRAWCTRRPSRPSSQTQCLLLEAPHVGHRTSKTCISTNRRSATRFGRATTGFSCRSPDGLSSIGHWVASAYMLSPRESPRGLISPVRGGSRSFCYRSPARCARPWRRPVEVLSSLSRSAPSAPRREACVPECDRLVFVSPVTGSTDHNVGLAPAPSRARPHRTPPPRPPTLLPLGGLGR